MKLPRICVVTETFFPVVGGGETQARHLGEGLVRRGYNVTLITRRSDPNFKKVEAVGSLRVHRVPPVGSAHLKKWGLTVTLLPVLYHLRDEYDLILVAGYRVLGIPAVRMARQLGKKSVLKADSLGEMSGDFFAGGLARFGLSTSFPPVNSALKTRNRVLRQADAFVAISSPIFDELIRAGVERERVRFIPNGIDCDRFKGTEPAMRASLREKLGLRNTDIIALYSGRLVRYKGLPLLLKVWREIQRRFSGVKLLLVGNGGLDIHNCEEELKAYVRAQALEQSVRFTGKVDNVAAYLQAADLFVFPTENEAFGISLVEAMACGIPVISTTAGGVSDILQHRRNGLQVDAGNQEQLYRALALLIQNPALRSHLGRMARQDALRRYSMETVLDQYESLFDRLLSDRPVSHRFPVDQPYHEL